MTSTKKTINLSAAEDLKRLEDEIGSLQKSVANLRIDIPTIIVKLLADPEKRKEFLS